MPAEYVLTRPVADRAPAPALDDAQRAVVDHRGGPLLVLAGPGTGKTTTLVEVVVERLESGELTADQVLVLTFSRKAAGELRDRIGRRLAGTSGSVAAMTFHAFCYALVREFSDPEAFASPPELMTAPVRDAVVADLLRGHDSGDWPDSLRQALGTRGLAAEIQSFMAAAAIRGLDPADVRALAAAHDRPEWARVADAVEEYLQVIDLQNLTDYTDLVTRAAGIAADPGHQRLLRDRYRLVVVDEYQDTDPLQVQLLHDLAGDGRDVVVVGDHDQAIYGFRGADPTAITRFPARFGGSRPAPTIALTTTRRFGSRILRAAAVALGDPPVPPGLDLAAARRHRDLRSGSEHEGIVEVATYASATAEAEHIAGLLRRAHLDERLAWSDMAVLVRTGADLTRLQRALVPAGVPVEVAGDEVPLVAEPAVRALLLALESADLIARDAPLDPEVAQALLTGPLAMLDGPALRRLGRALRRRDPETPSHESVAAALRDPVALGLDRADPATDDAVEAARSLADLLARAAALLRRGEPPEQALWLLWDGTGWPERLREQWQTGAEGRLAADRDLDAVCALFRHAARAEERGRRRDATNFVADLRAQQIPADQLESSAARPEAVRLMTAHRSKGLEWPLVVVAGVQADRWPDLRVRGSLLRTERLDGSEVAPGGRGERLREERRLFYVACTRATRRLVVTAVQTPTDDGEQPSRFVSDLLAAGFGPADPDAMPYGRPPRPVSLRGVVAELRRIGEQTDDPALRDETAGMLAELARSGLPVARVADPDRWWAMVEPTRADVPWRPVDAPVALSGSAVEGITACPLRWFLGREAHGESASTTAQGFGSIVHAIAADVVRRGVEPVVPELVERLDEVWHRLDHQAAWLGERERAAAHETLARFARWHVHNPRRVLAAEHEFRTTLVVGGHEVLVRGSMDRVEVDADGRVHVVDFKTSRSAPAPKKIAEHAQLGVYQVAVEHGAAADLADPGPGEHTALNRSGGAELVQLRNGAGAKDPDSPKVQPQSAPGDAPDVPFFAMELLAESARTVREERLVARPNEHCGFCDFQTLCPTVTGPAVGGIS